MKRKRYRQNGVGGWVVGAAVVGVGLWAIQDMRRKRSSGVSEANVKALRESATPPPPPPPPPPPVSGYGDAAESTWRYGPVYYYESTGSWNMGTGAWNQATASKAPRDLYNSPW